MPTYTYRAVDPQGNIVQGSLDAPNERALESRLWQADSELVSFGAQRSRRFGRTNKVSRKDLIGFCFHMEQVSKAGLPMLEALTDLRDSTTLPEFRSVIANLIISVEAGQTLSQAMEDFPDAFDTVFVSLVAVGEETGELPKVMQKLTESLKWQDELIAKSKSIAMYPAFVGVVVLSVLVFMMLYVVPEMVGFIEDMGQELPLHTIALIALSDFMVGNWYWVIPSPFIILLGIRFQARRSQEMRLVVDGWKLRLWYIGPIINKLILNRFASYFGLLYGAGLDVLSALKLSEEIAGNAVIKRALQHISASIADGASLSGGVEATGLFPPLVVRMIKMGEVTGELDVALENVSYFYDREVSESIDKLQAVIEPAMTVVLGAIMGWIMLSVLGPIYDTLGQLGL
ncbi:MAG: type II secretion system F family protein [Gammaproteobacteria bacterium]|nr:type II secretion system F family protein [Gammaproteobacteria bacterium]